MKNRVIAGVDYESFLVQMEEFHGYRSPGMLVGALMLDRFLAAVGEAPYLNVVCETVVCLPDAVQLLTPCTIGNGFLQLLDWGKFALTGYDRQTLKGERAWLDYDRMAEYPLVRGWFERTGQRKEKPPFQQLAEEILAAAPVLIRHRPVTMLRALKKSAPVTTGPCPGCGESYPLHLGKACPSCMGEAYCRPV
ncbi:MAG: formylmethanofuran dehydrogenase subunit E family protein [Desulfobacterales bacterium]|nr:formylmethanofuran dehydrogenase subunit E family protein [Desulfobacterales bacterium]